MLRVRALLPVALMLLSTVFPVQPAAAATGDWEGVIDITFPVTGAELRYIDDYDQVRSRGAHASTDIMAPEGTPIVAAMGGTIDWLSTPATSGCGYCLDIRGDDGRIYGYIHLGPKASGRDREAFSRGWQVGDRVERGQPIAFVGCSGNASCSPGGHHLHFQIEDFGVRDPYGDPRRNPYRSLRSAECRPDAGALFGDVCAESVHLGSIERLFEAELTYGCTDGLFCPDRPVTRDQMASFLIRALELASRDALPFEDVSRTNVHWRAIARLAEEGITRGCGDDIYCPGRAVTRQQMASFLVRALELPPTDDRPFADVSARNRHAADIAALAASGITRGCGGDNFCPDEPVTRAQMATFLVRALLG